MSCGSKAPGIPCAAPQSSQILPLQSLIGPGVKMMGGVIYNNLQGPTNAVAAQSWAALLGMDFRF